MPKERRDTDKKDRKHAKKASSSRKSSHKKDSRDRDRDRERSAKHRHKHKSSRYRDDSGAPLPGGASPISEDDYFLRATEFRVWLAQTKGKFVDDLSTEETTALFRDEFARKWNRGKLARMFYEGLPDAVLEQTKRTRHRWGFVAKLGERERFDLATAKDSVDVATRKEDLLNVHAGSTSRARGPMPASQDEAKMKRNAKDEAEEEEEEKDEAWRCRKSERKRQREDRDVVLDELAPKATGREAQLEKRRQVGQRLHGAARDREDARDGLNLSEDFILGGGRGGAKDDDFQRRLAQRDSTRRRKEEERQEKLAGLAAKESARMDKFLADMGLAGASGGKPMTIAPRR